MVDKDTTTSDIPNVNSTSSDFNVSTFSIIEASHNEKWVIIGGCIGIFVILILILVILLWIKIKRSRFKSIKDAENNFKPTEIEKNAIKRLSTSTDSSVDSIEMSNTQMIATHKNLQHSLSFDICAPYLVRKHSVQPVPMLPRWSSLTSPRSSVSKSDQNRSSDSDDSSPNANDTGRLWFSLLYDEEESVLQITLIRAKYLPARGFSKGARDPFVKVFLMPDEENFQQSKVRRRTLSPKFNETFNFKLQKSDICSRSIKFSVYDMDKKKIRHCLGHVIIALDKVDLTTNSIICKVLEKAPQCQSFGELEVSLACNPFNNRLKISITKAKKIDVSSFDEPFAVLIRAELFHGQKLLKHKTITARNTTDMPQSNFIFHECVSFSVPAKFYDSCYVALKVMASCVESAKEKTLGKINLGPFLYARGENLLHWQEMISNPRTIVTRWHKLEPPF